VSLYALRAPLQFNDGLEVVIDLTVLFRILQNQPKIFKEIGVNYSDKIVRPVT
jgi:hypothetical protein